MALYPVDRDQNKMFYTGKVIGDTYYRNLKLNNAILWSDQEFGLNVEILEFLKQKGIKYIFYIDTASRDRAFKITVDKFDQEKIMKEFSFGKQYFVKVGATTKKTRYPKLPYVKREVVIAIEGKIEEGI